MDQQQNKGGKGEIELKLENFIEKSFARFNLMGESSQMTRKNAAILMQELMTEHGLMDAWDRDEFDKVFDLFEEDDPEGYDENGQKNTESGGLDRNEFTKLVKRIA